MLAILSVSGFQRNPARSGRVASDVSWLLYPEAPGRRLCHAACCRGREVCGLSLLQVKNERSSATAMGGAYGFLQGGTGSAFAASYSYPESGLLGRGTNHKPANGPVYTLHSSAPRSEQNTR